MRTALGTIVMLIATSAIAQDHLRPEAGDLWNRDEYYAKFRKVFADTLRHDIVVETCIRSFISAGRDHWYPEKRPSL